MRRVTLPWRWAISCARSLSRRVVGALLAARPAADNREDWWPRIERGVIGAEAKVASGRGDLPQADGGVLGGVITVDYRAGVRTASAADALRQALARRGHMSRSPFGVRRASALTRRLQACALLLLWTAPEVLFAADDIEWWPDPLLLGTAVPERIVRSAAMVGGQAAGAQRVPRQPGLSPEQPHLLIAVVEPGPHRHRCPEAVLLGLAPAGRRRSCHPEDQGSLPAQPGAGGGSDPRRGPHSGLERTICAVQGDVRGIDERNQRGAAQEPGAGSAAPVSARSTLAGRSPTAPSCRNAGGRPQPSDQGRIHPAAAAPRHSRGAERTR